MTDDLWGVGPDARRAARPVVVCAALGVAAFAVTFSGALALGRGLSGSALAALLLPLVLSGAIAVGLAVAFVVAVAMEQPYGAGRVRRLAPIVTPLAALVALFAYAADPGSDVARPLTGAQRTPAASPSPSAAPPRVVSVPQAPESRAPEVRTPTTVPGGRADRPVTLAGPVLAAPVVPVAHVVTDPAPRLRPGLLTPAAAPTLEPSGREPARYAPATKARGGPCVKAAKRGRAHCHSKRWR